MDPITILAVGLSAGLAQVANKLGELVVEPSLGPAKELLKKRLQRGFRQAEKDQALRNVVRESLKEAGAPVDDEDDLLAYLRGSALDRLGAEKNDPLRRQVARAVLGFTNAQADPPDELMVALRWPKSRSGELSSLLASLRTGLATLDEYKDLLDYADRQAVQGALHEQLAQLEKLGGLVVESPTGEPLALAVHEIGLTPQQEAQIEHGYRQRIEKEFRVHAVQGLAQVQKAVQLPMQDIYLELGLAPLGSEGERCEEMERMLVEGEGERLQRDLQRVERRVSNALAEHPRLVITGKPGSGKTFTLRFTALMLAMGEAGAARLGLDAPYLPVLVRLADYARRLYASPGLALETFLLEYLREHYAVVKHQEELLQLALEKGACMVLLDGLDEVGDFGETPRHGRNLRGEVLRQVGRFASIHCGPDCANRLVVTSRLEGYQPGDLPGFSEMELSPLKPPDEVEDFLLRWFSAYLREHNPRLTFDEAQSRARRDNVIPLMQAVMGSEGIRRLAINPLLLTILAIIHEMGKRLPNRRVELYQVVAKTMVENWRPAQTGHTSPLYQQLSADKIYYILASLAYWLHENRPGGTLARGEWQAQIIHLLELEGYRGQAPDLVENFLSHACQETGLLTERSPGQIGFFHLTLEEYLAAVEIARAEGDERLGMVEKHWADPRWQEVTLLTAGELDLRGNRRALQSYLHNLLDMETKDPASAGLPALLAGRALADAGAANPDNPAHQRVLQALLETMQDLDAKTGKALLAGRVPARRRADAADVLDELGYLPPDLYRFLPIDPARLASAASRLPSLFYLGQYPVTNAQYARFLGAEDFADRALWAGFPKFDERSWQMGGKTWGDQGWQWLQEALKDAERSPDGRVVYPRYWNDPRFGIARRGVPVVGITWYEASAYCRWLERHWAALEEGRDNPGWQPKPGEARLPTEAEWIIAAGGDQPGERYPWDLPGQTTSDQQEILRRANVGESGIGRTTPVGMYPLGASQPYGLWDMGGNVWEWQANYASEKQRVLALRGGAWRFVSGYARLSLRNGFVPGSGWLDYLGFRVLARP